MKRHSPSESSLQQTTCDNEEPRSKKIILVDPSSCSDTDNEAAAGALPKNSTVTAPPPQQEQPQFLFSAHSSTRLVSRPLQFKLSATPATSTQGQGMFLRRCCSTCSDDLIAPPENNDDFDFFTAPTASPSIPASLVRSESLPSCEPLSSFSGPSNTAVTSPETTLPQRRPSRPPAPAPFMTQTKEKTDITAMTDPKDSSRSSESGQTGVCSVALTESPAEKRLIRMKKRVEDMQKWLQVEEAEISAEDRAISTIFQNLSSSEEAVIPRSERERGVTIETEGRGFGIHCHCNCGRRHQVQISLSDLMTVHFRENKERMP